jgi:RES domain-containing protein
MFAGRPPDAENTRGARWNPPGVAAIYLSKTRDGALAEAEYHLSLQTPRPHVRRTLYEIELTLDTTLDLTDRDVLADLNVGPDDLDDPSMAACREVGGAASWLGQDGLLVPSARSAAINIVVFPLNRGPNALFEVRAEEEIAA